MSRTATITRAFLVPASALAIVVLVALVIPPALSSRYRLTYNERAPAPLAQVDPLTVDEIVDAARRAGGRTVYWIGDSVVWSGNETGTTTAPQLLEAELRRMYGSDVHVINAALPASRTADKYGILLKILEGAPSLVIYESKYLEFSRTQVETITFRYPYLNDIVSTDPAYGSRYQEFFRTQPHLVAPRTRADVVAETTAERLLSFVRYRALLQQIVLGGDLYARLSDEPLPDPLPPPESGTSSGPPAQAARPKRLPSSAPLSLRADPRASPAHITPVRLTRSRTLISSSDRASRTRWITAAFRRSRTLRQSTIS
jgi:hypothetical protein